MCKRKDRAIEGFREFRGRVQGFPARGAGLSGVGFPTLQT